MRKPIALFTACLCLAAAAPAQSPQPLVYPLWPDEPSASEGIVIPAGSPLALKAMPGGDSEVVATFDGRFTLTGTYELEGYGEGVWGSFRPDSKSLDALPYWRERGRPEIIYLSNPEEFAAAVVARDDLRLVKAGELPAVRGRVTILAEDFQAAIECDAANFSARFVSVVEPAVEVAEVAGADAGC